MNEANEPRSAWSWGHEATEPHTRILRLALAVPESRAYWARVDPDIVGPERAEAALDEKWFRDKSDARVRYLLASFLERFDAFPNALPVLRRWSKIDEATAALVCHWHVQLADPIYRRFTGELLVKRRATKGSSLEFEAALRWFAGKYPGRWSDATNTQFASKLLSAASEAGLVHGKRDPREVRVPAVSDLALAYVLFLLRETRIKGSLVENPYLASVGLHVEAVEARLRAGLPGVRRSGAELEWAAPSLAAWGEAFVSGSASDRDGE